MIINLNEYYRKATSKELDFYHRKLYPLQDQVFQICSIYEKNIYLTGGTTLSRFYYQHRLSEDLDFFTTTNDLKLIATDLISRLNYANFQVQIDRLDVYFARFFILQDNWRLKIEFVREYNLYGDLLPTDKNIYINTIEDLGANKISAFEDRAEIKDIIDLYYITQNIDL
ncbi:MAG TPA: nucleotidyl transferase AbiEii/AbiGii toxin family protein, partial [Allocoleopsis sp.]